MQPTPNSLPAPGTRVEAIPLGGKPGPKSKYATGVVRGCVWDSIFNTGRLEVIFDQPAGTYYGQPILRTSTFASMIHIIGSNERPFSTMTPAEIEALYLLRRSSSPQRAPVVTGNQLEVDRPNLQHGLSR